MTEVSEDQMAAIVSDGISFMRTITQAYGSKGYGVVGNYCGYN